VICSLFLRTAEEHGDGGGVRKLGGLTCQHKLGGGGVAWECDVFVISFALSLYGKRARKLPEKFCVDRARKISLTFAYLNHCLV
jgi:hypothetical protein